MSRWWLVPTLAVGALLVAGAALPHLHVVGAPDVGRWLVPAAIYFLNVQAGPFSDPAVNRDVLGLAFNVSYLGIGLHQFGTVLAIVSFWVLGVSDINRWIWRILVVGGWLLGLSGPAVITGWLLINAAGVPARLGVAWLPAVLAGLIIIIAARLSKDRIDYTWYVARPELQ